MYYIKNKNCNLKPCESYKKSEFDYVNQHSKSECKYLWYNLCNYKKCCIQKHIIHEESFFTKLNEPAKIIMTNII